MRDITVSTEVFASIWSKRMAGEDSENAILERILGISRTPAPTTKAEKAPASGVQIPPSGGVYLPEFRVHFPEGQEIFRVYKGQRFSANAQNGRWLMNGKFYPSLHKLSMAIVKGRENSWNNWKFLNSRGKIETIDTLRRNQ